MLRLSLANCSSEWKGKTSHMWKLNKEQEFRNINEQNKNEETVSYSPPWTSITLCIYLFSVQIPGNSGKTSCHIRSLQKAPIKTYGSLYRNLEITEKGKVSRVPPPPAPAEHSGKGPRPPPAPVTTGLCSSCRARQRTPFQPQTRNYLCSAPPALDSSSVSHYQVFSLQNGLGLNNKLSAKDKAQKELSFGLGNSYAFQILLKTTLSFRKMNGFGKWNPDWTDLVLL